MIAIMLAALSAHAVSRPVAVEATRAALGRLMPDPVPRDIKVRPCRLHGDAHGTVYGRDGRFGVTQRWKWVYVDGHAALESDDGSRYSLYYWKCKTGQYPR